MESADYFFIVFLATIVITRAFLYFKPIPSPTVKNFRFHHYMYGLVLIQIGIYFQNLITFAIGLGLFVDELTFLLIGGKDHEDNYSVKSIVGTIMLIILVYFLKENFVSLI